MRTQMLALITCICILLVPNASINNTTDLTINVNATNGTTFNQYHVIRTVNASLNDLLNVGYKLTSYTIQPNISINLLVNIYNKDLSTNEINTNEISVKIEGDLNKNSHIVYVVQVTENNDKDEEGDTKNPLNESIMNQVIIGICCFLGLLIIISEIDARFIRINDYHRIGGLIIATLQLMDIIYDCLFAVKITLDPDYSTTSPLFIILILCISFIIIPTVITLLQLHFEIKQWKSNHNVSQWITDNSVVLYVISAICGSSFVAVRVCCSNFFSLSYFDMPLSQLQKSAFFTKRIYSSVMLENLPQLAIQIAYLYLSSSGAAEANNNHIVYGSMSFSLLSIIISILSMLTKRNILKSRDYVTIEFDVKGDAVIFNFNQCKNRYKSLRRHLSMMFGINRNIIEIKKPSQVPNGLRAHIILHINNTTAIDINCHKLINDANESGKLGKILKESWSLSRIPIIENVKYKKCDSQLRTQQTVVIKTMSEQIRHLDMQQVNSNTIPTNNMMQLFAVSQTNTAVTEQPVPSVSTVNYLHDDDDDDELDNISNINANIPRPVPSVVITAFNHNNNDNNNNRDNDIVGYVNNVNNDTKKGGYHVPPVVVTDFGQYHGHSSDDSDSHGKLTPGTTGSNKQTVIDYNTADNGDNDIVDYVNIKTNINQNVHHYPTPISHQ